MKNNKGITIISLVITVIVLLILAGISINMISGNNSILKRVTQGKENMEVAKTEEQKRIGEYEVHMPYPVIEVETEAKQDSVVKNEKPSDKNPIIPKGFKAIDVGENAKWSNPDGYKYGLVIEDVVDGEYTKGSQFVWVPVENYEDFHAIEGYYNQGKDTYLATIKEAGESTVSGKPTEQCIKGTEESIKMYQSVHKYKGFYIARYEAGIAGDTENYSLEEKTKSNGEIRPLSKAGCAVWNYISWGGNNEMTASDGLVGDDSADGIVKVARSMYNSSKYGARSTLCYGVQWDAALNFLDPDFVTGNSTTSSIVRNSASKGYYGKSKPSSTGYYAEKNIYDLAGNVYEFTMETGIFVDGLNSRVARGGAYAGNGKKHSASLRVVKSTDFADRQFGFRVVLLID